LNKICSSIEQCRLPYGLDELASRSGRLPKEVLAIYERHLAWLEKEASAAVRSSPHNTLSALAYKATVDEVLPKI